MLEPLITAAELTRFASIARRYDPSYYCQLSYRCGEVPGKRVDGIKNLEPFFCLTISAHLGAGELDPVVCTVWDYELQPLEEKLWQALDRLEDGENPQGYLPALPAQVALILELISDERTAGATRLECFTILAPMLSQWGANRMTNMLEAHLASRLPGTPGYAALHGLLGSAQA